MDGMFSMRAMRSRCGAACIVLAGLLAGGCDTGPDPDKVMAEAKAERDKGAKPAAIILLKNLLQANAEHGEARFLLGSIYVDAGDPRSAEKELRRALELKIDRARVLPVLGRALLMIGEYRKVLDEIKTDDGTKFDDVAGILALRGMAQLGLGKPEDADRLFDEALAKQAEHAEALIGKARIAAADKKLDAAAQFVDRALAKSPNQVEALLMRGDLKRMTGDVPGATAAYQKVLEVAPDNTVARLSLSSLMISSTNYDEAKKQIDAVKKSSPQSPMANYMQALIEFRKNNYTGARDLVQQVLKAAPNHAPSILLSGATEFALDSHELAQSHLKWVLDRSPGNLYARKLMVASLAKSGQVAKALETLEPALKGEVADPTLLALAGEVYMQSNDFEKAKAYFDRAAKADPKNAGSRTGLALSRLAAGETEQGIAELESATQIDVTKYQADVLLVMSHLQRGKFDQALKAMQVLEKKQPDNPLTHNLKAAILIGRKDFAAARTSLERAVELKPGYMPAIMNLAQLDVRDNNAAGARKRIEAVIEKDPKNVQAYLALVGLAPRIGADEKQVVDWLERATRAAPGTVQPMVLLSRHYLRAGDRKRALELAQQMLSANSNSPEALETAGAIQLQAGEKNQALTTFSKLVALQPSNPTPLVRFAFAQSANGDETSARQSLRKALQLKPDHIEAQLGLAELEVRGKRPEEGLKIAQQVQKQAPKVPAGFLLEGDIQMSQKNFAQAVRAYDTALGLGRSGIVAVKLHAALSAAGKGDEAMARLTQWLKTSPDDATVRLYLAENALKASNFKLAAEQYEAIVAKQPDNVVALNNLAWAYQQSKDGRAKDVAERAYKIRPDNPAIMDTLGWLLVEQGDARRGTELLQKAVSLAPESKEIRYHLAQAWLKADDKAKAKRELEQLLANEDKFAQRAEAMALLKKLRE